MIDCKTPTERLLRRLKATIVRDDADLLTIQVIPGLPAATVQIKAGELRTWLFRRLESRAAHKGYGLGIHSRKYRKWY